MCPQPEAFNLWNARLRGDRWIVLAASRGYFRRAPDASCWVRIDAKSGEVVSMSYGVAN